MKTDKKTCEVAMYLNTVKHRMFYLISRFNALTKIQNNTNQDTEKLLITKEALLECTIIFPIALWA